ncbi:MAG: DoxX family protein [Mucilaginibacter sp.]
MNQKTSKTTYWVLITLFCLFSIGDAFGGLTKAKAGVESMQHLGYPIYLMPFLSVLKLSGVIALLQNRFKTIKEWAFAGFAFTFIGAFVSRAAMGDSGAFLVMPPLMLVILFVIYYLWRKS